MITKLNVTSVYVLDKDEALEPPLHEEATAEQIRHLVTKGARTGLVLISDDVRGQYETLKAGGFTDVTQEPTNHFYGTDMGIRDPFGNPIRILQQGA